MLTSRGGANYKIKEDNEFAALVQVTAGSSGQDANTFQQSIADKEINTYTQALQLTRKKIVEAQEDARSAREMAERAKSELLELEFSRGNANQELDRLSKDLARKRGQIATVDAELRAKGEELKTMANLGVSKEDCLEVKAIREDNLSLKSKLRNLEGLQLERDELVRQLDAAKDELFREQKLARVKIGEMQEEIDTLTGKLEEAEVNWTAQHEQMMKLEKSFRRTEREKNDIIQEKTREFEELKATYKEENSESQSRLKEELTDLDQEVQKLRSKVNDLHIENAVKDAHAEKLRCEVNEIGSILDQERQGRHQSSAEHKKVLQQLRNETASAVMKLKESMFLENHKELEEAKRKFEEERTEAVARNEEKLIQVLEEHSFHISEKDAEIANLEDALRRMETYRQELMEQQVLEAVAKERERSEFKNDWHLRQEKEDERRRSNEIYAAIDKEKQVNGELQTEIANLKKELDEQKKQQREASKDKLVAVARTKDQMKEQNFAEIERIKFNLKQESETELERLNEKVQKQDVELERLRQEIENSKERERQALKVLDQTERTVLTEIQKECQRMSGATGVSSMMLHSVSLPSELHDGRSSPLLKNRMAVTSALASLRSCHDDLLYHIAELHQEQESLQMTVKAVTKEKNEAIDTCRLEMDRKRVLDLEKLKETLLKEHVSEMSNVIRECAETNTQLKTNSQILQRYGDAALLEALQAKDDELRTVQVSLNKWQEDTEDKYNTQLQLQVAKEREKYQALQHYSSREQKRVNDLQKREIERLEKELQRLVKTGSHDSNRYVPLSHTPRPEPSPTKTGPRALTPPSPSSSLKSSQQFLQNRIEQLQSENAALRKQRLLNSRQLSLSASNLSKQSPPRPQSSLGRSLSPSRDVERRHRLEERIRQSEEDTKTEEERAKMSNKEMNNKMEEMMKLQNTLYVQNQELQELERSYNDLQKHYHSRPCSPTRNLNCTM